MAEELWWTKALIINLEGVRRTLLVATEGANQPCTPCQRLLHRCGSGRRAALQVTIIAAHFPTRPPIDVGLVIDF